MELHISRKQKALLLLPLVVIPFITLAFWTLGGGGGEARTQGSASTLNLQLPEAKLKETGAENKMSFYDRAEKDSRKVQKAEEETAWNGLNPSAADTTANKKAGDAALGYNPYPAFTGKDPNEEKVYQKLAQLNQQLNRSTTTYRDRPPSIEPHFSAKGNAKAYGDRTTLKQNDETAPVEDSDMQRINGLMEKVLDIQHPERVSERLKEKSRAQKGTAFPVTANVFIPSVSLLDSRNTKGKAVAQFYGLNPEQTQEGSNSMGAVVQGNQRLVDGAVIKLRLQDDVFVNGQAIAKGSVVYGTVSLNGERLQCTIPSIRSGRQLFSVNLHVYDLDGLPGLYVPGTITRDVAKSSVDNAAQLLEVTSLDPSLKAQATSTGLNAVKSLLTKKAKLVSVSVKDGYQVLLKNGNE